MKYILIVAGLFALGLIVFTLTRKSESIPKVNATYNGLPEDHRGEKTLLVAVHAKWASVWLVTAGVLANLDSDKYDIMLINADDSHDAVKSLGVEIIPTVIVYQHGKEIARLPNMMNADQLPCLAYSRQEIRAGRR